MLSFSCLTTTERIQYFQLALSNRNAFILTLPKHLFWNVFFFSPSFSHLLGLSFHIFSSAAPEISVGRRKSKLQIFVGCFVFLVKQKVFENVTQILILFFKISLLWGPFIYCDSQFSAGIEWQMLHTTNSDLHPCIISITS